MHKISSKEIFCFTFFLCCFMFPGFGDTLVLKTAKNASIISAILGTILGLIPVLMIVYIINKYPNKNIFEINKKKFNFFGSVLNILLIISMIYILFVASWGIINFTISQFLTRTSYYLIIVVISFLISIAILKKTEVIGRTNIILFMFFVFTTIFGWIFLIPNVEIENFFPIIDVSKTKLLKSIFIYPTFSCLPLISLLFIKKENIVDKENISKRIIWGYLIGSIMVIIFLSFIIGIFGINMSVLFSYPEYSLFKKVNAFSFIQRIENVISLIVFIATFTSFCIIFNFIKKYLETNIKKEIVTNIIIVSLIFLIPLASIYIFQKYLVLFLYTNYPQFSIIIFMVLFINFLLLLFSKKELIN